MLGACCLRKRWDLPTGPEHGTQHGYDIFSVNGTFLGHNQSNLKDEIWYSNIDFNYAEVEDLKENHSNLECHKDPDFNFTCDYLTLRECQTLKDQAGETRVISFSPGVKCSDVRCGEGCGCFFQNKMWRYGEKFMQGCEECICTLSGRVDCLCRHLTRRKDIRDLTLRERRWYQRAIRKLYARPGKNINLTLNLLQLSKSLFLSLILVYLSLCVQLRMDVAMWKGFALLRAEFSPLAGDGAFFLPWHRYFLRLVERELQSISSCKLALPYFEWTVDSGSMKFSTAWEAGFFGGDGQPDSGCVPHHPFQGLTSHFHWSPCLRRSFNSSVCHITCIYLTAPFTVPCIIYCLLTFITGTRLV